jgi:hypothetical protein
MTPSSPDISYAVLLKRLDRGFELRIRELLLSVRADSFTEGWHLLLERKREIIDCVRAAGLLDQLPLAKPPPPI